MSACASRLSASDTALLDRLPDGVACYETVRDDAGTLTAFRLTYRNSLFAELAPAAYQHTLDGTETITQSAPPKTVLDRYADVINTGHIAEHIVRDTQLSAGVYLRVAPFGEGIIITARPEPVVSPEQYKYWIGDVLNASLNNTFVYEAIRDLTGQIQDFRINFINRHAREDVIRRFGVEPLGSTILTIYPSSRQSGQFPYCVQAIETGQPVRLDLYYEDVKAWYDTLVTPLGDGCIVTGLNITDRKLSEELSQQQAIDQERLVHELQQSNENLRQFAQVASHDLQEPLRKIQTFSDILQSQFEDSLSDGERDMTRRIQKSAKRMQMLIKDLLTYSQLATQRDPLKPVNMTSVIEDVISDLEITIAENNARIETTPLPTVLGSASRLRQLMQNLITNALKFKKADQVPVIQIRVRLAEPADIPANLDGSGAFWLITVSDNGLGFEEKYKDRIFHPFQRLHTSATYAGTGIGLAICQRVAESLGGAIDVSSRPNEGSVFKVLLPVYASAD